MRLLKVIAAISIAGIVLTSTHDGGAQWGPRFLLVASPPMMVLACRRASSLLRDWRTQSAAAALVVVILVCGLLTSRLAYRELRGAKKYYSQLVQQTADVTGAARWPAAGAASVVVTNVWWLDQILAPLYGTLTVLFVDDAAEAAELSGRLQRAGEQRITLMGSREEPALPSPAWLAGTCFVPDAMQTVVEREVVYVRAARP